MEFSFLTHFFDWWTTKDVENSPEKDNLINFLITDDPRERLAKAFELIKNPDPLVFGILVHDFCDSKKYFGKYNQDEPFVTYASSTYPEALHDRVKQELMNEGKNSFYFKRVNHADALAFMSIFYRQSDFDVLMSYLQNEKLYTYFHYSAFEAIQFYNKFHSSYKNVVIPMLKELMYVEEKMIEYGNCEFESKYN